MSEVMVTEVKKEKMNEPTVEVVECGFVPLQASPTSPVVKKRKSVSEEGLVESASQ